MELNVYVQKIYIVQLLTEYHLKIFHYLYLTIFKI